MDYDTISLIACVAVGICLALLVWNRSQSDTIKSLNEQLNDSGRNSFRNAKGQFTKRVAK